MMKRNIRQLGLIGSFSFLFISIGCNTIKEKKFAFTQDVVDEMCIEKIEIMYVDMFITTFSRVECSAFRNQFSQLWQKKLLIDSKNIVQFEKLLKETLSKSKEKNNIDTRVQGKIYYTTGVVKQICFGLNGLEFDGKTYLISEKFTEYLLNLTETD